MAVPGITVVVCLAVVVIWLLVHYGRNHHPELLALLARFMDDESPLDGSQMTDQTVNKPDRNTSGAGRLGTKPPFRSGPAGVPWLHPHSSRKFGRHHH
jgi:hypothetical protein